MSGWSYPRNMRFNKAHFIETGATHCLCGQFGRKSLFKERDDRRRRVGTDHPCCIEAWCAKYEPGQKVFVRQ